MSAPRWTDADLRAAWEAGVRDGWQLGGRYLPRLPELNREWEKSIPRARIRALEIANSGVHG